MKLGTKIFLGFGLLLFIAIALGGIAIYQMARVSVSMGEIRENSAKLSDEYIPEAQLANELNVTSYQMMYAMRGYGLTFEDNYLTAGNDAISKVETAVDKLTNLAEDAKNLKALQGSMTEITTAIATYKKLKEQTEEINRHMDTARGNMDASAGKYVNACQTFLDGQNERMARDYRDPELSANPAKLDERLEKITRINNVIDYGNATRIKAFKAQADRKAADLKTTIDEQFPKIEAELAKVEKITYERKDKELIADIRNAAEGYETALQNYLKEWHELDTVSKARGDAGDHVVELALNLSTAAMGGTDSIANDAKVAADNGVTALSFATAFMIVGLVVALVIGVTVAIFITRSITGPINRIIDNLTESSSQVASASGQIATASQSLAEGSTEQAASLEETSSALEEMASMTRQNADNAGSANTMMSETKRQVDEGAAAVKNMAGAMDEINQASEEIGKIIKTIEEIAFQTNLLALNAAVEAARAGDAGKGFAVVADEVRNLAQRSAQAARDTSELIESTVARVKNGTEIVRQLEVSFGEVEESANKVAGLVAEISSASQEQAQGVDQVNTAVAQMDKVTQNNASNAEESASASEELSAQAEQMNSVVGNLIELVGGAGAAATRGNGTHHVLAHQAQPAAHPPAKRLAGPGHDASAKVAKPNQVIPLEDDEDFGDF